MYNNFFTADCHLGHDNIRGYCNRPFSSVEEMDEAIIRNWNSIVDEDDLVYILGDFAWKNPRHYAYQLNGNKILILGSHDKKSQCVGDVSAFREIIDFGLETKIEETLVTMCHYCLKVWPRSHYNSIMLYGHSHNRLPAEGKSLDVGMDGHNFFPWSWDEIKTYMETRPNNFNFVGDV